MKLAELLAHGDAFLGYAYAYPHKTAYRPLSPPVPLREAWAGEEKDALFLYAHIPFCEMRCGFCNLFTTTHPADGLVARYLAALEREAAAVSEALGKEARFTRVAIGGGTPTFLALEEIAALFATLHKHFAIAENSPVAVELSPATTTSERLAILREWAVTRVSLGVQSFIETETRTLGRRQAPAEARAALTRLREADFPVLNLDLIYGIDGQTRASWRESLRAALEFAPEEIYLYPLYVRPLTGLDRQSKAPSDLRSQLYEDGRAFLLELGYRQISMRLFRVARYTPATGPEYCCQEDGMVGLGAGARSYTADLHYSTEWAVGRDGIGAIIDDYAGRDAARFAVADYGCKLTPDEQRRRYVIKSLLRTDGLNLTAYQARFSSGALVDLPELTELIALDLARENGPALQLTECGLGWSDAIGPWLFSNTMRTRMEDFTLV